MACDLDTGKILPVRQNVFLKGLPVVAYRLAFWTAQPDSVRRFFTSTRDSMKRCFAVISVAAELI